MLGIFPVPRMCSAWLVILAICSLLRASEAARRSSARWWAAANLFINFSFARDHMRSTFTYKAHNLLLTTGQWWCSLIHKNLPHNIVPGATYCHKSKDRHCYPLMYMHGWWPVEFFLFQFTQVYALNHIPMINEMKWWTLYREIIIMFESKDWNKRWKNWHKSNFVHNLHKNK